MLNLEELPALVLGSSPPQDLAGSEASQSRQTSPTPSTVPDTPIKDGKTAEGKTVSKLLPAALT